MKKKKKYETLELMHVLSYGIGTAKHSLSWSIRRKCDTPNGPFHQWNFLPMYISDNKVDKSKLLILSGVGTNFCPHEKPNKILIVIVYN